MEEFLEENEVAFLTMVHVDVQVCINTKKHQLATYYRLKKDKDTLQRYDIRMGSIDLEIESWPGVSKQNAIISFSEQSKFNEVKLFLLLNIWPIMLNFISK